MIFAFNIKTFYIYLDDYRLLRRYIERHPEHSIQVMPTFPSGQQNVIPVGGVEWCELQYGQRVPEYYPWFISPFLKRTVCATEYKLVKYNTGVFVKPASEYKLFSGTINGPHLYSKVTDDQLVWFSDIVQWRNEWRLYVSQGKIIDHGWYANATQFHARPVELDMTNDTLSKLLKVLDEEKYSGVIDIGEMNVDGNWELAVVEASHPYAMGWYSTNDETYGTFLIKSHDYLLSSRAH